MASLQGGGEYEQWATTRWLCPEQGGRASKKALYHQKDCEKADTNKNTTRQKSKFFWSFGSSSALHLVPEIFSYYSLNQIRTKILFQDIHLVVPPPPPLPLSPMLTHHTKLLTREHTPSNVYAPYFQRAQLTVHEEKVNGRFSKKNQTKRNVFFNSYHSHLHHLDMQTHPLFFSRFFVCDWLIPHSSFFLFFLLLGFFFPLSWIWLASFQFPPSSSNDLSAVPVGRG